MFSEVEEEPASAPAPPSPPSSSTSTGGALVAISEDSVQFTAGVLGGVAGFALAGPVGATIGAGFANFASKTVEDDVGDVIKTLSKTSLEVYNYMVKLDNKYTVLKKAQDTLQSTYDGIKDSDSVDPETIQKVRRSGAMGRGVRGAERPARRLYGLQGFSFYATINLTPPTRRFAPLLRSRRPSPTPLPKSPK